MIDRQIIKFGIRVREINKNYELNNNCDLDNGVFNKFAQAAEKIVHENLFSGGQNRGSRQLFAATAGTAGSSMINAEKLEKAMNEAKKRYFDEEFVINYDIV